MSDPELEAARAAALRHSLLTELDSFITIRSVSLAHDSEAMARWAGSLSAHTVGSKVMTELLLHNPSVSLREIASVVRWILRHQADDRARWVGRVVGARDEESKAVTRMVCVRHTLPCCSPSLLCRARFKAALAGGIGFLAAQDLLRYGR